jgi:GNAT superfamily N-acetyltransferase
VSLERVTDAEGLVALELAAARGFGVTIPEPGAWHGPAQLDDPRQALWIARSGGEAVGTATAFNDAGVVGIYAISTVPPFRRRGIGGALTRAAAAFDPSRPAVLQASEMAIPLYRSIGFDRGGAFRTWVRPPVELPA